MSNSGLIENGGQAAGEINSINLYLARFEDEQGLFVNDKPIPISGEMLVVEATDEKGERVVEAIQRFSMWSPSIEEFKGVLSLAGVVNELKFPPSSNGDVSAFDMRIYFPSLGKLGPAYVESDAEFVRLETLRGRLNWTMESSDKENSFFLQVVLFLDQVLGDPPPVDNLPKQIIFKAKLEFFRLEESGGKVIEHHSLSACSGSAPSASGSLHDRLNLKIRFVDLSTDPTETASLIEHPVIDDLVKGACEVWWEKAGVRIDPEYSGTDTPAGVSIVNRPDAIYSDVSYTGEGNLNGFYVDPINPSNKDFVVVYLVHRLLGDVSNPRTNGGITHLCGGNDAYVILEIEKAKYNRYLLAHELGHVLGIRHPNDLVPPLPDISFVEGSGSSVMTPNSPNSSRNTGNNLSTLVQFPIGSVLKTLQGPLAGTCRWDDVPPDGILMPQNYYHVIRDFPYDDGTEDSIPYPQPPVYMWWTHSSVWNAHQGQSSSDPNNKYADNTDMFNPDHSPIYTINQEPTYSGPNWMYARVHAAQKLTQPVKVYFYISVPGSATEPLKPLLPNTYNSNAYLDFSASSFPKMGEPKAKGVRWDWDASGYPSHCCVFAVVDSANEPAPPATEPPPHISDIITNPNAYHFYDLHNRLASDNDVAQRNLNVQGTPPPPSPSSGTSSSSASMLAWVQIDNPFEKEAPASLRIDATQAGGLESLTLEANDESIDTVKPGERKTVTIDNALKPGDHKIIRIRATLPPKASVGMSFPLHLQFMVNNQLVSGYTHILRVVRLSEAILQVLDLLFGSLRAVAVGCKSELAQSLANKALKNVLRERGRVSPGCLGFFWRLFRSKNAWRSEVTSLSGGIAALAQSLEGGSELDTQAVRQRLYELADLLGASKNTPAPIFIEQIRELLDYINEPACWLARHQLKV